jgi:hypothetical protein
VIKGLVEAAGSIVTMNSKLLFFTLFLNLIEKLILGLLKPRGEVGSSSPSGFLLADMNGNPLSSSI